MTVEPDGRLKDRGIWKQRAGFPSRPFVFLVTPAGLESIDRLPFIFPVSVEPGIRNSQVIISHYL
jgi:hypothetical protein